MDMLDEENYVDEEYGIEPVSRPNSDTSQSRGKGGDDLDASLDPLLACMPGMELQEEDMQKFLQVNKPLLLACFLACCLALVSFLDLLHGFRAC